MKYRKKPVVIEAHQLTPESLPTIRNFIACEFHESFMLDDFGDIIPALTIKTLEGWINAANGDFIVKGVKGEFYPVKPDIFAETYEIVEEDK